jgi:cytochrome c oxidase cbb3-type subunit IV
VSQGTFAGLLTVALFAAFIIGVIWAYSGKRKAEFDAAARLPLDDGEPPRQGPAGTPNSKSENGK